MKLRMMPCPGEAHVNAHIDNCGLCAPLWGVLLAREDNGPVTKAVKARFARMRGEIQCELLSAKPALGPAERSRLANAIALRVFR